MNEEQLDKYLSRSCKTYGVYCRKLVAVGQTGFPDRLLVMYGQAVFVELKSPTGKGVLSAKQKLEIGKMSAYGLDVRVIDSTVQVDALIAELMSGCMCHA